MSWSSSSNAIATVSNTGLATGVGEGTATITATSEGVSETAQLTVELGAFSPTANTSLSGNQVFSEVDIPAGVTVTATADLNLTVAGPITIDGDLVGECVEILIDGAGTIDLSGDIDNDCAAPPAGGGPDLTIVGNGELNIDGTSMTSSGDIDIANSPDLPPIQVPMDAFAGSGPARQLLPGSFPCVIQNYTVVTGSEPPPAAADGVDGAKGIDGKGFAFGCNGNLAFRGNVQIETQDGGAGGNGEGAPDTTGGHGGYGGDLLLQAFGDLSFTHETLGLIPNQFFAGDGAPGGNSISDQPAEDPVPDVAPGSSAEAGWGGNGGAIRIHALNDLSFAPGSFFAGPGSGGWGGNAESTAADGVDGSARQGEPAQIGGPAESDGGLGGDAPGFLFLALGDIIGDENIVFDDAADGGDGGESDAWGGDGGDGESEENDEINEHKHGAKGGEVTSFAGDGGSAGSGRGGDGGLAILRGARGGDGWIDCRLPPDLTGGDGGMGGNSSGGGGALGAGLNPGVAGNVDTYDVSNGGDGGDGEPDPGDGGMPGTNGIAGAPSRSTSPARTVTEKGTSSFEPGEDGGPCKSGTYQISVSVLSDPGGHNPFIGLADVSDVQLVLSSDGTITISGSAPWVTVTGTRDPATGEFWANGTGLVAGLPNVTVSMHGILTCDNDMSTQYTMGVQGELFGIPIIYLVFGFKIGPLTQAMRAALGCLGPGV